MGETAGIIETIEQGLVLLNKLVPDQATRIANKIKEFREKWDEESSKKDKRVDADLDGIERELRDIRSLFGSALESAALKIK